MAEELIEFRYSGLAKGRDVAFCLLAGGVVGLAAHVLFGGPERIEAFIMASAGACTLGVLVLGLARWRAQGRLSETGIAMGHGPHAPWAELSLDAVEEIRLYPDGAMDFSGAGIRVHVSGEMEGAAEARRRLLSRRGFGLFDRLLDAYRRGETLEFRGPRDPEIALYIAGSYAIFLGVPLVLLAPRLIGVSILFAFLLYRLLRREATRSMTAAAETEGLRFRFGFRIRRIPWVSMRDARLREDGSLRITLASGGRATFPPTLSNFAVLQELVLRRLGTRSP